jgi:HAMP domain-containing protein
MYEQIGRYKVLELIGEGAMAEVYKVYDPDMDCDLALKILKKEWCGDNQHENDCAHSKNIFHRDIKPSNILMDTHSGVIKITDFGIASIRKTNATRLTQHGMVLGTPHYMSPEQWKGLAVDGRADLFAVGVILYQLCSGEKPFDGDTLETLGYKVTHEEPPPIGKVARDLPVGMRHLIGKLLMKSPEKRFSSGEQLAVALRHELASLQAETTETSKYIPIKVRWTIIMGMLVAITSLISIYFIEAKQNEALTDFAIDSGASLEKFVANVTKQNLLREDWVSVDTFVKKAGMGEKTFEYLYVLDHDGLVRGVVDNNPIGREFAEESVLETIFEDDKVRVVAIAENNGRAILDFNVSVQFDNTEVGRVRLGLMRGKENSPLLSNEFDSGVSFGKSIANETSKILFDQDWRSVDAFVKKAALGETFEYLYVLDQQRLVRGVVDNRSIGNKYVERVGLKNIFESGGRRVAITTLQNERAVLDFNAPIQFGDTEVGRVRLGLLQEPLEDVVRTTRIFLVSLAIVTILAASVVLFFLAQSLSRRIRSLRSAIEEVERGNFDCRIPEKVNDELGETFVKFNKMVSSFQERISNDEEEPKD